MVSAESGADAVGVLGEAARGVLAEEASELF